MYLISFFCIKDFIVLEIVNIFGKLIKYFELEICIFCQ